MTRSLMRLIERGIIKFHPIVMFLLSFLTEDVVLSHENLINLFRVITFKRQTHELDTIILARLSHYPSA